LLSGFDRPDLLFFVFYTRRRRPQISKAVFSNPRDEGILAIWFIPQCETKFCKIDRDAKK
jgi:hypothetical protein